MSNVYRGDPGTFTIPKLNEVERGKERYGASESAGYGESERAKPNPYSSQNEGENKYHFSEQGQASLDHWGGKSEAKAGSQEPTPIKTHHSADKGEVDFDINKDISLHDSYPGVEKIHNPGDVDEGKWKEAKAAAEKEYGPGHWAVVSHIYKSMHGKFHKKS